MRDTFNCKLKVYLSIIEIESVTQVPRYNTSVFLTGGLVNCASKRFMNHCVVATSSQHLHSLSTWRAANFGVN